MQQYIRHFGNFIPEFKNPSKLQLSGIYSNNNLLELVIFKQPLQKFRKSPVFLPLIIFYDIQ